MDIKDMKLFLSIAEEENLTRAAKKNGYTQSAASHILKRLEGDLGFPLCSRSPKGLTLTKNGKSLVPHVRQILSATEYFDQAVHSIRNIQKGYITIGIYLSASVKWLPIALKQFCTDYPHIIVEMREGTFQEIQSWLDEGSIDFGISSPASPEKMEWLPLKKERYKAVCSLNSPYAKDDCFHLMNLDKVPYIAEKHEEDLFRQFRALGICPHPRYFAQSTYSMVAMAKHNLGVCILPELALSSHLKDIATLPLTPPIERTLGIRLPSLKKAPSSVRQLISQLQKSVYELEW